MSSSKKLVILIVVAAIVGALIYWYGFYPNNINIPFFEREAQVFGENKNMVAQGENQISSPEEVPLPKAGENINAIIKAIEDSVSVDQSAAASEDSDNSYLNSDSKEITDFGQSYNEQDY
jgi:hypothetical protein